MAKRGDIKLGDTVKDTITGVEGVVVCISDWLNGCQTISVQQRELNKDGHPHDRLPFDVEQLEVVPQAARVPTMAKTGGDAQDVRSGRE